MTDQELTSPGRRLTEYAAERPDEPAVTFVRNDGSEQTLSWVQLEAAANRLAHRLAERGVDDSSFVAILLPNSVEHVVATQATWKLGACAMPISPSLPAPERDAFLDLAKPAAIVAAQALAGSDHDTLPIEEVIATDGDATPPPDRIPAPWKAVGSGGSTGRPKLIVAPGAFAVPAGSPHPLAALTQLGDRDIVYLPGPLYHNQTFLSTAIALFSGATVVLNERFEATRALDVIERLGVTYTSLVPTMMGRMLRVADVADRDLSSLRVVMHMAAPCPDWVKRGWIDLVGAERVLEVWAATELTGITLIRGDEWLAHPGSVGKPVMTEVRILDDKGEELPQDEVGEIYSRMATPGESYAYLGADPLPETEAGLRSVGDLGWLDADGYLYLADRRSDLIISGGANVYPAEVEAVLSEHVGVADVVVVGLTDDDLGQRVHAIVQPDNTSADTLTAESLDAFCRERLAAYKCPRGYELVEALPRGESGKVRRGALRTEREAAVS